MTEEEKRQAIRDQFREHDRDFLKRRKESDRKYIQDYGYEEWLKYLRRGRVA